MATTVIRRPARLRDADPPDEPIRIAEPPKVGHAQAAGQGAAMIVMPVVSGGGGLLLTLTNQGRPLYAAAGLLFLVASVAIGVILIMSQRSGQRRQTRESRERYLDYTDDLRRRLRYIADRQRSAAALSQPPPAALLDIARGIERVWERRRGDPDFLRLRVGIGAQPLTADLDLGFTDTPLSEYDPLCLDVARNLARRYSTLGDQPVSVPLAPHGVVSVLGHRAPARDTITAAVAQLVALHSPDDVRLAVVRSPRHAPAWEWVKWLPHTANPAVDAVGESPVLVTDSVHELVELLTDEWERRIDDHSRRRGTKAGPMDHLVVVIDGENLVTTTGIAPELDGVPLADLGIHVLHLLGDRREEPERVDVRMWVGETGANIEQTGETFTPDKPSVGLLPALTRALSPRRLAEDDASDLMSSTIGLPELLGVTDVAQLNPQQSWKQRPQRELLRVPIGVAEGGRLVLLDVKESAQGGMGPHGLVVGATGSGKSEMLRTMVTSLVIGHAPDRLALLLVDFKGGATFAGLAGLPHISGMITNLSDDEFLVDRFRDSLYGEMQRRQQLLSDAGNLPNVTAYQQVRDAALAAHAAGRGQGPIPDPLPHLLVIVDEFSELLTAKPDFAELFVAVGRIGRSIGVHQLLATQRLDMGKIRGLESHLSYRISLRTFSEAESRDVIGVPDAFHLPPEPGSGFLKVDTTVFERFKAALVSTPYRAPASQQRTIAPVLPFVTGAAASTGVPTAAVSASGEQAEPPETGAKTVLDVAVDRLSNAGAQRVHQVWLEPLPAALTLDAILPRRRKAAVPHSISAPLGLLDDPLKQRQDLLEWDPTGNAGNLLVLGGPQTGKSTLLRTMIAGMALSYEPGRVAFYCVDFGGGTLGALEDVPHVAAAANRADPDRVRRTVAQVQAIVTAREQLFRQYQFDSMDSLRKARAEGTLPPTVHGDIFLIIDGWSSVRDEIPELEDWVGEIAARGGSFGVHVVLSVLTDTQVRMRMQASFGGRLELRMIDPFDSKFERKLMQSLPKDIPGRGLAEPGLFFQVALPRVDGVASADDLGDGVKSMVRRTIEQWPSSQVERVKVLPASIKLQDVPFAPSGSGVSIGLSESDLGAAVIDLFDRDPHLLIYGDGQTGKSNAVRVLAKQLMAAHSPAELTIVMVDYRRSHLDLVPNEYNLAYCTTTSQTLAVMDELYGELEKRLPGPEVTAQQLRDRSWWNGPEVVILVDDYDLVSTSSGNPLQPLVDLVAQAIDIGFHLVLARRSGGAGRAVYEAMVQRLGDVGTPGLMFSGERSEGALVAGVSSQELPVGRAIHVRRGSRPEQVQLGWSEPPV